MQLCVCVHTYLHTCIFIYYDHSVSQYKWKRNRKWEKSRIIYRWLWCVKPSPIVRNADLLSSRSNVDALRELEGLTEKKNEEKNCSQLSFSWQGLGRVNGSRERLPHCGHQSGFSFLTSLSGPLSLALFLSFPISQSLFGPFHSLSLALSLWSSLPLTHPLTFFPTSV